MAGDDDKPNKDNPLPSPNQEKVEDMKLWGIFLFGLIGATATTFAVGQLRRTVDWFYVQLARSQSSRKGATGSSFRSSFQEEAWKKYNRRMQEEYEEEMERVERIRRMQSVFNRERNKYKRGYESWKESGPGAYHQHFQREDWYWKTDSSYKDHRTNYRETPRASAGAEQHHILMLRLRQHSGPRQRSFTQIRTRITKMLPRQSLKR
ncbi:hypothetical protein I3760_07G168300 [Carya illinoinensis]|nr:hypothetical protein I3760_07G168300 [Carya illinoinensis]